MAGSEIAVASPGALAAALEDAHGGEVLALAPGEYGDLFLGARHHAYPETVAITSAQPESPAVFSELKMKGAANIRFEEVVFDYVFADGDGVWTPLAVIRDSREISIVDSLFSGDTHADPADVAEGHGHGYGYGYGLRVIDSAGIDVTGNEFAGFWKGLSMKGSDDLVVAHNDIHSMRSDGMNFVGVKGLTVQGNFVHDFAAAPESGDHPDMLQVFSARADRPTTDVAITANRLDKGDGSATQMIFMRNDKVDTGAAGRKFFYRDIEIRNNDITGAHLHGITVGETIGLTIAGNTLHKAPGAGSAPVEVPRINVAPRSEDVRILDNASAGGVNTRNRGADWTISGNVRLHESGLRAPDGGGESQAPAAAPVEIKGAVPADGAGLDAGLVLAIAVALTLARA